MEVSVSFLGPQRTLARVNQIRIPLSKETSVADVVRYIKKSYPTLPLTEGDLLVAVNNKLSTMDRILENKDNITFLPFLGGG